MSLFETIFSNSLLNSITYPYYYLFNIEWRYTKNSTEELRKKIYDMFPPICVQNVINMNLVS
jgi:ribonucleotide reductase alpha subunit